MADKRKREIKPETREKLRQLALERHKEGKFGGAQYGKLGGRPRKVKREALDAVSEAANTHQEEIINVFRDAVADNQPIAIRLRGAESWLNTQKEQSKLTMQEEEAEQKQFDRAQVIELLSEKLTSGPAGHAIRERLESTVDSTAIEVEENGDGPHG
jgi:hypothetical protein